jgi:hypothetical protein
VKDGNVLCAEHQKIAIREGAEAPNVRMLRCMIWRAIGWVLRVFGLRE